MTRRRAVANALATLALVASLGGSAYAAIALPSGQVGAAQLRRDAVTAAKVKPGTLSLADVAPSQLPSLNGPVGPAGATGPQGPRGDAGPSGRTDTVVRTFVRKDVGPGVFISMEARCDPGEHATGGGVRFEAPDGGEVVQQTMPVGRTTAVVDGEAPQGWRTLIKNTSASAEPEVIGYVICARP